MSASQKKLPWIYSKSFDLVFFFFPSIFSILIVLTLYLFKSLPETTSNLSWLMLVVLIDVAHVWSSLFRTYLNEFSFERFKTQLIFIPLICFLVLSILYLYSSFYFWRLMAYLALFHFMRQQVGFLAIYLRNFKPESFQRKISSFYIWLCMLVPVLDWHTRKRQFNWFIADDFLFFDLNIFNLLWISFFIISICYIFYEIKNYQHTKLLANAHILITFLIWSVGISFLNNDFAFSLTNIIHHGVPYIGLIWISSLYKNNYSLNWMKKKKQLTKNSFLRLTLLIGVIVIIAIIEETLWDSFLWHERENFLVFSHNIELSQIPLAFMVGLLATPQVAHYLLDGLIWKREHRVEEFNF